MQGSSMAVQVAISVLSSFVCCGHSAVMLFSRTFQSYLCCTDKARGVWINKVFM
jgi:hypothetical protein